MLRRVEDREMPWRTEIMSILDQQFKPAWEKDITPLNNSFIQRPASPMELEVIRTTERGINTNEALQEAFSRTRLTGYARKFLLSWVSRYLPSGVEADFVLKKVMGVNLEKGELGMLERGEEPEVEARLLTSALALVDTIKDDQLKRKAIWNVIFWGMEYEVKYGDHEILEEVDALRKQPINV